MELRSRLLADARTHWLRMCPYAVLVYASHMEEIRERELRRFVLKYVGLRDDASSVLAATTTEMLLSRGHLQERNQGVFRPIPTWAIRRDEDEWTIHGHTGCDPILGQSIGLYDVEHFETAYGPSFRRLFVSSHGASVLKDAGIVSFTSADLLGNMPYAGDVRVPDVDSDLQPAMPEWQRLGQEGYWERISASADVGFGVCRGVVRRDDGGIRFTRYFFRHGSGWSRLTFEEAMLLEFAAAARGGHPFLAIYSTSRNILRLPRHVPPFGRLVAEHLGRGLHYAAGCAIVHDIALEHAQALCDRLLIRLSTGGDIEPKESN